MKPDQYLKSMQVYEKYRESPRQKTKETVFLNLILAFI